ncbi:MAG TPA: 4-hydroxy-tetrahydrodipicolinate synthase, partial [Thermodesulfobacteriota bacterium]|nr:4-hydroxy-tetrahydrodipicolinate synthase [Thermodesulfobacteriota bacterium]
MPGSTLARFRGSLVPSVTPFRDGRLDEAALAAHLEWLIAEGSHGLVVCGTTGEPNSLSHAERQRVYEIGVEVARGRVPVLAGTGTNELRETLDLCACAERLGVDALMVVTPYYVRPSQEGLFRWYRAVAESTALPVFVYDIPGRSAVAIAPETLARLREACPNIVGVKASVTDVDVVSSVVDLCGPDFLVLAGLEHLSFPMLALGAVGSVSATANVLPRPVAELHTLVEEGRLADARRLHYRLLPMNRAVFFDTNPGPVKAMLGLLGRMDPEVRPPLAPVSPEVEARLRQVLARYGLPAGAAEGAPGGAGR